MLRSLPPAQFIGGLHTSECPRLYFFPNSVLIVTIHPGHKITEQDNGRSSYCQQFVATEHDQRADLDGGEEYLQHVIHRCPAVYPESNHICAETWKQPSPKESCTFE
jgi:hypothetical protein